MGNTNEDLVEHILVEAHNLGISDEVNDLVTSLMKKGVDRYMAYSMAFHETRKKHDEIYRERHKGLGAFGTND